MSTDAIEVRALAPWFGAGRTIAKGVGEALCGCTWVGVPSAGDDWGGEDVAVGPTCPECEAGKVTNGR